MTRRLVALLALVAIAMSVATVAWAAWTVTSADASGNGRATSMPGGAAPSVSAAGATVTVSWSASSFPGGPAVSGYVVRAYNAATSAPRAVAGTCAGTVSALTCSDTGAPSGTWKYTIQPRQGAWTGAEGATSAAVLVDTAAPVTTDNTAAIGATPRNTDQTVTLTPTDAGSGVAATYYTTNGTTPTTSSPQGTTILLSADGSYTIKYFSVDANGNAEAVKTASTVITIDKTAPAPTALTLTNSGTAGTADRGDRIDITLSEVLSADSICPDAWAGGEDKILSGNDEVIATITNNGSNDVLTVASASCTGGLRYGSVALGGNYVTTTRTFSGNGANSTRISWTVSTRVLSIQLGKDSGGSVNTGIANGTPVWTPSSSITDLAGNAMAATPFNGTSSRL